MAEDKIQEPEIQKYLGRAPKPRRLSPSLLWKELKVGLYLLVCPLLTYEDNPISPEPLPAPGDHFEVSDEQLQLAKTIDSDAEHRRETLETKAEKILGILIFLAPLFISVIAFTIRQAGKISISLIVLFALSGLSIFIGFIAGFRANGIRIRQKLSLSTLFDANSKKWLDLPREKYLRGLLWCASWNEAMNDHAADFIRAARLYTIIGMLLLIISAIPLVFHHQHNKSHGSINQSSNMVLKFEGSRLT